MSTATIDLPPGRNYDSDACMATLDRGLRIVSANAAMLELLAGRTREDLCGTAFLGHLHPSSRTTVDRRLERLVTGQEGRFHERSVTLVSGETTIDAGLYATAFSRDAGGVESIVVTVCPTRSVRRTARPGRSLTEMDTKILEGVAAGASTHQLAANLFLSRGGIEYHVSALLRKMRVKNRPALISKAYAMGMFEMGTWPPQVAGEDAA